MSAFEGKADMTIFGSPLSRSLLGVKRTYRFALLGHTKIESTVRYLGIDVDDALTIAEQVDV